MVGSTEQPEDRQYLTAEASDNIQPSTSAASATPSAASQPDPSDAAVSTSQRHHAYAQLSSQDDNIDYDLGTLHAPSETDPLYPPPPPAYYRRGHPLRITHWGCLILVLAAVALACLGIAAVIDASTPADAIPPTQNARSVAETVLPAMDRSADPCDNFYEYACGSWLRSTVFPPDRAWFTKSFDGVGDRVKLLLKEMLENKLLSSKKPVEAKVGTFYSTCMSHMGVGKVNTVFLDPFRESFATATDAASFSRLTSKLHRTGSSAFFDVDISADDKNPSINVLFLSQPAFGLPHRDNYLGADDRSVEMRRRYITLIQALLAPAGMAGLVPRQGHDILAQNILNFETTLANMTAPPEEMRDPDKLYNKLPLDKIPAESGLSNYFSEGSIDLETTKFVILDNPEYFAAVFQIFKEIGSKRELQDTVKGYLAFHLARLAAAASLIGKDAYMQNFKFKQYVRGIKQVPEKWRACLKLVNRYLGEGLGAAFVEQHFSLDDRHAIVNMSVQLTSTFTDILKNQPWMDDQTKAAALEKIARLHWKLGASAKPDTFDDVVVSRSSFQSSVTSACNHKWKRAVAKIGKPVEPEQWEMLPYEINAYYSPVQNEMVFPAGILRPSFFSSDFPAAMNYGAIGAIIGHEMSHGYDDQGRKYDKDGLLSPWWSQESAKSYEERSQCFVDLYDTYKPRDVDIHVIGKLTLGENLADFNGLNIAYRAFKRLGNNSESGAPPPNTLLARELTNDQLFFVAYAQNWCTLYRPQALKVLMKSNPHPPWEFRVLGPLSQSPIFAEAFQCHNGSRYNPEKRCKVWEYSS